MSARERKFIAARSKEIRRYWGICRPQAVEIAQQKWTVREDFCHGIVARGLARKALANAEGR